jgi:hypothetical protein
MEVNDRDRGSPQHVQSCEHGPVLSKMAKADSVSQLPPC